MCARNNSQVAGLRPCASSYCYGCVGGNGGGVFLGSVSAGGTPNYIPAVVNVVFQSVAIVNNSAGAVDPTMPSYLVLLPMLCVLTRCILTFISLALASCFMASSNVARLQGNVQRRGEFCRHGGWHCSRGVRGCTSPDGNLSRTLFLLAVHPQYVCDRQLLRPSKQLCVFWRWYAC